MENIIANRVRQVPLTKTQQKIADYFIRNPERVGMCSSMEVAKEALRLGAQKLPVTTKFVVRRDYVE